MCGITFVHRTDGKTANKAIMKRYQKQKSRGSEGFGYIAIKDNKLVSYKRAKLESTIKEVIEKEDAGTILFHHRYPTSTPNFKESAHPIKVSNIDLKYDYYLVHNGIITNADDLKEKHEKLGFSYNTEITQKYLTSDTTYKETMFNDSEALAIDVALAIDKKGFVIEARGSIAFIVAQVNKASNKIQAIWFSRNSGSPLKIHADSDFISIGSESEGSTLPVEQKIHRLDLKTNKIKSFDFTIPEIQSHKVGFNYGGYSYNDDGYGTTFGDRYNDSYLDNDDYDYDKKIDMYDDTELSHQLYIVEYEINRATEDLKQAQQNDDGTAEYLDVIADLQDELIDLYTEKSVLEASLSRLAQGQKTIPFDDVEVDTKKVKKAKKVKSTKKTNKKKNGKSRV